MTLKSVLQPQTQRRDWDSSPVVVTQGSLGEMAPLESGLQQEMRVTLKEDS